MRLALRPALTHPLILVALVAAVYANTLHAPFIFDDRFYIVENPVLSDASHFTGSPQSDSAGGFDVWHMFRIRYVGFLSFFLNYALHGPQVEGFHMVNLALHAANVLLVYWFTGLLLSTPAVRGTTLSQRWRSVGLGAALLFALHPVQTQAVTYITQRFASLAAFFFLVGVASYIKARVAEGGRRFLFLSVSVGAALLAMKTKENAFTLPLVICIVEFAFFRASLKRRFAWLLPLLLTLPVIPMSVAGLGRPLGEALAEATRTQLLITRTEYFFTQFRVLLTYVRLLLFPVEQTLDYDYPVFGSPLELPVAAGMFALGTALLGLALLIRHARRGSPASRLGAFGLAWFFVTISVESSVIALADVIFEHRLYLPSAGLFLAAATGLMAVWQNVARRPWAVAVLGAFAVFVLLSLCMATVARNQVWNSEVGLWEDAYEKAPAKLRVMVNLALAYLGAERPKRAIRIASQAVGFRPGARVDPTVSDPEPDPDRSGTYNVLGLALMEVRRFDEAANALMAAVSYSPRYSGNYVSLAVLFGRQGDYRSALNASAKAIELARRNWAAWSNAGLAYGSLGQLEEAIEMYEEALRLNRYYSPARYNLGMALLASGKTEAAAAEIEPLRKLNPELAAQLADEVDKVRSGQAVPHPPGPLEPQMLPGGPTPRIPESAQPPIPGIPVPEKPAIPGIPVR